MKKILLTGASGFIGMHTIPFLLESNYEIHAITQNTDLNKDKEIQNYN
ncbi:GDP-mannose 4,6-dehydratase, partial [Patescibacteria group bacterium]|nr:GDP-mannose 4,6-dehydratase [Patescibacteria group bacterium]